MEKSFVADAEPVQPMEALINDLLLLSRIENQGRSQRRNPVDVETLLESILEDAQALIGQQSTRVTLSLETRLGLKGDETQLLSAFFKSGI